MVTYVPGRGYVYEQWERDHDTALVKSLSEAKFVEEETDNGWRRVIKLAHLTGVVLFDDGVMYWSLSGNSKVGGEKPILGTGAAGEEHAKYLLNYGRKAVKNELQKLASRVVKEAKARLEAPE